MTMATLFDEVYGVFNEGFAAKAATALDESESGIQQALTGALPISFARLVQKTDNVAGSMDVYNMANEGADSGAAVNPATLLYGGDLPGISEIDVSLFGDKLTGLGTALAHYAGIKQSSAVSILTIAGITTLAVLGMHAREYELSATDLGHMIQSQKEELLSTIPSGLDLADTLEIRNVSGTEAKNHQTFTNPTTQDAARYTAKRSAAWIVPTIFLLIIVVLVWNIMKSCHQRQAQQPVAVPKSQEP